MSRERLFAERVVNSYLAGGQPQEAVDRMNAYLPKAEDKSLIHELIAHAEFSRKNWHGALDALKSSKSYGISDYRYQFSYFIHASCYPFINDFNLVLRIINDGRNKGGEDLESKFDDLLNEAYANWEDAVLEAERRGEQLISEEQASILSEAEARRRAAEVQVKAHSNIDVEPKGKEEKEKHENVAKEIVVEYTARGIRDPTITLSEFNPTFKALLLKKSGDKSYIGTLESVLGEVEGSTALLEKSFIRPTRFQVDQIKELVNLCSRHENLLSVEHVVGHYSRETGKDEDLLITDAVFGIKDFFLMRYEEFASSLENQSSLKPNEIFKKWWDNIHGIYWSIFRDLARGLLYLFVEDKSLCGDLESNAFVTSGGRGRILPSLDSSKTSSEDVADLIELMTCALYLPSDGKRPDNIELPHDLENFLTFVQCC